MNMAEKYSVVLCGKSLFMAGVALNLGDDGNFQVIKTIDPTEIRTILRRTQPVAIIVDSDSADRDWVAALNRERPDISVIALNPENSAAFIYSWRQEQVETFQDLKSIILELFPNRLALLEQSERRG
ncbi:hypothetical protein SPSIL_041460 [Sporomusa silvacetica DSM 10669]|uniref:Response regulatory domain-containing protein n=1 Tax=Sporomusa silvacetica DSM 10669 TaxID=1123289 RepID=A0ABZ3IQG8_9FIRM|nr:hypothetical protein [Sporomusa silvacetica]OZC20408.1 hypothetical protein SPSIL_12750 [Sporomusa silvacetica DSM 10669]